MNPYDYTPLLKHGLYLYPKDATLPEEGTAFKTVKPPTSDVQKAGASVHGSWEDEVLKYAASDLTAIQSKFVQEALGKAEDAQAAEKAAHQAIKHVNFAMHYGGGMNKISSAVQSMTKSMFAAGVLAQQAKTNLKPLAKAFEGVQVDIEEAPWANASAEEVIQNIIAAKKQYMNPDGSWQGHANNTQGTVTVTDAEGISYKVQLVEGAGYKMATTPNVKFTVNMSASTNTSWQLLGYTTGDNGLGLAPGQPVYFGPAVTPNSELIPDKSSKIKAYEEGDSLYVVGVDTVTEALPILAEFIKKSLYSEQITTEWKRRLLNVPDDTMYVRRADQKKYPDPADWPYVMEDDEPIDPSTHQKVFVWD